MNHTKQAPKPKYRPVLTADQILHILYLAKTEQPSISSDSMSLISSLAPFQAKIENAGIQAAYVQQPAKPKAASLEGLGGLMCEALTPNSAGANKEAYWEQRYLMFKSNPVGCSLETIAAAKEHMYLNDLMSAEEIAEFEDASMGHNPYYREEQQQGE